MVSVRTQPRRLSNAEDRREAVLAAALPIVAERGLLATPTLDIARAAGISHAYLFRLFETKIALAAALTERCHSRIYDAFAEAAAEAQRTGDDPLEAMGAAYAALISNRELLLCQLHANAAAAASEEIRAASRAGWARLFDLVRRESSASDEELSSFFATGMLMNVMTALGAAEVDEPWATALVKHPTHDDTC